MKRVSDFIVEKRLYILTAVLIITLVSFWLNTKVDINTDMSNYLPGSSSMKIGTEVMEREFPDESSILNVMFTGLVDDEKGEISAVLSEIDGIERVSYDDSAKYNVDDHTLYTLTIAYGASTEGARAVMDAIAAEFSAHTLEFGGDAAGNTAIDILPKITGWATIIALIILFTLCNSWLEPPLFLFTILIAVFVNMGTNIFLGSVSNTTYSVAPILQMVLSMDYSIMLLNRYRQEKLTSASNAEAMKRALNHAFTAIAASSITTIVGMLALVFMSFTIGRDLGLVLAKGVLLSLLSIFTVLPGLILLFDKLIEKTAKPSLPIKMDAIGAFGYNARKVMPIIFILLFVGSFLLRGNVVITYSMADYNKINQIFAPNNQIVVLYENANEDQAAIIAEKLAQDADIDSVDAFSTTLNKKLTPDELAEIGGISAANMGVLMSLYGDADSGISMYDFAQFMATNASTNPMIKRFMNADAIQQLKNGKEQMDKGKAQFIGENYSRMIINTHLPEESAETAAFITRLTGDVSILSGEKYLIGASIMACDMQDTFPAEMNRITILTAIAIFIVVAIAFRSLAIPLLLTLLIQCAVFITMGMATLQGVSMYYLPLLIVQCLLLGATVDYGILLTSYYKELRMSMGKKDALIAALNQAIHTILTSGLILTIVTGVLGLMLRTSDPAISEIIVTIAKGGVTATTLVVFILPGLLSAADRFIVKEPYAAKAAEGV